MIALPLRCGVLLTELSNEAGRQPEVVERLASKVLAWQRELPPGPVDASAGKRDYPLPSESHPQEIKGTQPRLFGTAFALTYFDLRHESRSRMLVACRRVDV